MSYTIMISEGQRKLLLALLEANPAVVLEHQASYPAEKLEYENLDPSVLCDMFRDLSGCGDPEMVHGFCL